MLGPTPVKRLTQIPSQALNGNAQHAAVAFWQQVDPRGRLLRLLTIFAVSKKLISWDSARCQMLNVFRSAITDAACQE